MPPEAVKNRPAIGVAEAEGLGRRGAGFAPAWLSMGAIFAVTVFSYVDRSLLSVLQEPIKHDLELSDGQLGALTGLAFALAYSTIGIPISRMADRLNRKRLMVAALVVWSLMTACSGLATGFAMLIVLRMGLALGESACGPAVVSLISDLFPRPHRGVPMALMAMATPLGTMAGMIGAGWIGETQGWRAVFVWVGLAGIVLAPLLLATGEPRRGRFDGAEAAPNALPFGQAMASIWSLRTMRYLLAAGAAQSFTFTAIGIWIAPFYTRLFGLSLAEVGFILGTVFGLLGGASALFGGFLVDRLGRRNVAWYCWLPAIATFATVPVGLAQLLAPSAVISITLGGVTAALLHMHLAPLNVALQSLAHPRARGLTAALLSFLAGTVGLGLGPLVTGLLSDLFASFGAGAASLRYAMLLSLSGSLIASMLFQRASHCIRAELRPADSVQLTHE